MSKQLDLRGLKTFVAARRLYKWLHGPCKADLQDPSIELQILAPCEAPKYEDFYGHDWVVGWEAGPHEWAIHLTGGLTMYAGEGMTGPPEVLFDDGQIYIAEPGYSFTIQFSKQ